MSPLKKAKSILQSQLQGFCWPPLSIFLWLCFWLPMELFSWGVLEEVAAISSALQFSSFPLPGSKHQEIFFCCMHAPAFKKKKKKKKASPWPGGLMEDFFPYHVQLLVLSACSSWAPSSDAWCVPGSTWFMLGTQVWKPLLLQPAAATELGSDPKSSR